MDQKITIRILGLILVVLALSRLVSLGSYPLLDPTEGRYGEIARNMVALNDWVTPRLEADVPFWGKPPLSFWLTAIAFKFLGVKEFIARFPSWLLAIFSVFLTYILAADFRGRGFGLASVVLLSSLGVFYVLAGGVMTDPSLGACITLSMVSFAMALRSASRARSIFWGYLFFAGVGLVLLAKGPVGVALIGVALLLWTAWHKQWGTVFRTLPWLTGSVLTLLIAVPWHLLAEQHTPGFLKYYIIGEHFDRFLVKNWEGDLYAHPHGAPRGTIWPMAVVAFLPWTINMFAALRYLWKDGLRPRDIVSDVWLSYFLFWCLAPFLFFTLAGNIMITYTLSATPAFAVLTLCALLAVANRVGDGGMPWFLRTKILAWMLAVLPIGYGFTAFVILPIEAETRSQKPVIAKFEELSKGEDTKLIYSDTIPPSADFYSLGKAEGIPDTSRELFVEKIRDDKLYYLMFKKPRMKHFSQEDLDTTKEVADFGVYVMRKKILPTP